MIKNENYVSFISIDTLKPHPEISFDFLPDHVEIVALTNQGVLLCHTPWTMLLYGQPYYQTMAEYLESEDTI